MKLIELIVRETFPAGNIIRRIYFKESGLNLIVDETVGVSTKSGNSVGKTTAVKIIDLCLGAKSVTYLYRDKETGSDNEEVKNYLNKNKVVADLYVGKDNISEIKLTRELFSKGSQYINDEKYSANDFNSKLKEIFFKSNEAKPSFRQLIPRFVRLDDNQLNNILFYLVNTTIADYEVIHLFLLNILDTKLLSQKGLESVEVSNAKKEIEAYKRISSGHTKNFFIQNLSLIEKNLKNALKKRNELDYIENYRQELETDEELNFKIISIQNDIDALVFSKNLVEKSLTNLNSQKLDVNENEIRDLYNEATHYLSSVTKDFSAILAFHNSMINNRIAYVEKQKENITLKIREKKESLSAILANKKNDLLKSVDEGMIKKLFDINKEIDELNVEKGKCIEAIDKYNLLENNLEQNKKRLNITNITLSEQQKIVSHALEKFNEFFSNYSKELYNEKYYLYYDKDWENNKVKPFTIQNLAGNAGTGKKKGQVVAFDLSYLKYLEVENINFPMFIIHDKMESTHINQLNTIIELCKDINGQYILPILSERLHSVSKDDIDKYAILKLSQEDKFFHI